MAQSSLKAGLLAATLFLSCMPSSDAAMAVIDVKSIAEAKMQIAELKKQLDMMQEHLDVLNEARDIANETMDAIGEAGDVSLPLINPSRLALQISKDVGCLLPDLDRIMPGMATDELDWESICAMSNHYRQTLIVTKQQYSDLPVNQRVEMRQRVRKQQSNVFVDAATKGLAQADIAQNTAKNTLKASQEYRQVAGQAEDMNARLALLIDISNAQLVATAQSNQLLAQLLKVQSAYAIMDGPILNDMAVSTEGEGDAQ